MTLKRVFIFLLLAALALSLPHLIPRVGEESPDGESGVVMGEAGVGESERTLGDADYMLRVKRGEEILEMSMEDYLPMALAGEMPAAFREEALKAQAVALRTYALHYRAAPKAAHPEADVCTSSECCCAALDEEERQEKWGEDAGKYWDKLCGAASATDGQYLIYGEEAILAMFHSSSYGATEEGGALKTALPYLRSVSSPETEESARGIVSRVEVSPEDFRATVLRSFPEADFGADEAGWLGAVTPSAGGRVGSMVLGGQEISGLAIRQMFALRSTDFELEWTGEHFLFTVWGYGHGLGMSQYGANAMAAEGRDYREILAHYYPETELVVAAVRGD